MKKFELTATLNDIELYNAVFVFTKEEEEILLEKIKVMSEKEKLEGENTTIVDDQMSIETDVVIRAMIQARGKDHVAAFEKAMKKDQSVGTTKSIRSIFGEIQWGCKRIGNLKAVK